MEQHEHLAQNILQCLAKFPTPALDIETDDEGVFVNLVESRLRFHHGFISGPLANRARQSTQAIIKSCSNKQRNIATILDLTAGWGADSLTLAGNGKQVMMLEQNPLVYAIVAYSLNRLGATTAGSALANRLSIENTSALDYLSAHAEAKGYDCIYLDPMFPAHKSGAKPAKEMQILQALTGNIDIEICFETALQQAHKRVVVKRPAKAPTINALKPDLVYREKTIRFDVYLTR
jgi:16S rRNA (guanine1516-N2)-methyltransferase